MSKRLTFEFESKFGRVQIGGGLPVHLIAEIGLNHNGSMSLAKELIRSAAISGAHSVKFQKRSPEHLVSRKMLAEPFAKAPYFGSNQGEVRARLEFSKDDFKELKNYSEEFGLLFFSSVFDLPSLEVCLELGVTVVKVASHSITNGPLLRAISETDLAVIASTGAAKASELDAALELLSPRSVMLMHCVSSYPTIDTDVKLDTIHALTDTYSVPVGFSSHENGTVASLAAAAMGAVAVERHFTLSTGMAGLDQSISLEPSDFAELSRSLRRLHSMRGSRSDILESEMPARFGYHVGLYTSRPISKGTTLSLEDIVALQPAGNPELFFGGLEFDAVVGRQVTVDLEEQVLLSRDALR